MSRMQAAIGSILCLIASMSWGAMFPVAQSAMEHLDPLYFSLIRYLAVTLLLSAILVFKEGTPAFRLEGKGLALLFYGTMAFVVYNMLVFSGQNLMGDSGVIAASLSEVLMPMIAVLIVWITTRKAPPLFTLISVVLSLAGSLLVVTNGNFAFFNEAGHHISALVMIVIGVVGWVIYSMGGSRFPAWSTLRYSALTCLFGSAASLVIVIWLTLSGQLTVPTAKMLYASRWEMAFMILVPGVIALLSWNAGLKKLSPSAGILFINAVPVTTFIILAFQGHRISMYEAGGTLLVIYALIRNQRHPRRPGTDAAAAHTLSSARHHGAKR